ncbi:MAG TPA: L-serine ammonia-lyase, iron-sulfur-dependent subunit beta [Opitutus sp.]|nr:L-serine ammonia-lyase, iron-sulfur-dependent subunit beta [Opitutus sp.]
MAGLNLSAFDVIGPTMVGPSSSHTAGAARIGFAARQLLNETPILARFQLHGSFAATGRGHATDRALLAGVLGETPDSEWLAHSFARAREAGLGFDFSSIDLGEEAHPNTAVIHLTGALRQVSLTAASVGGGVIAVTEIDGHPVAIQGSRSTLVCWHADHAGFLSMLTTLFAEVSANIASISTNRKARGGAALTVVEADETIPPELAQRAANIPGVNRLCLMRPLP